MKKMKSPKSERPKKKIYCILMWRVGKIIELILRYTAIFQAELMDHSGNEGHDVAQLTSIVMMMASQ